MKKAFSRWKTFIGQIIICPLTRQPIRVHEKLRKIINHSFCNQYNAFQSFQFLQPFEPLAFYSLVFLLVNLDQSDWSILDQSEKRNERSLKFSARPGRSITLPIKKSVHPKTQILTNQIHEPIENQNF